MSAEERLVERSLFPQLPKEKIYFDTAGAALYNSLHVDRISEALKTTLLVNPHSSSDSEVNSIELELRSRLSELWAIPEEFEIIFTRNATEAIQLAGRIFNFSENDIFCYTLDNHTSIAGLRKMASGDVYCYENEETIHPVQIQQSQNREKERLLIAYPAQSNFDGFRGPSPVDKIQKYFKSTSTYVLLDIASLVSSSAIPFSFQQIDFAPFSFYKLFGLPTSLGGLIIRKTLLKPPEDFFGGGSVKAWLPTEKIAFEKDGAESWSLGSPPSSEMLSALIGLNTWLELTKGLSNLSSFLSALYQSAQTALKKISYPNGAPAFQIYNRGDEKSSGPIITFNVKKANGTFFRPGDISRLMASEGFIIRSGCMCNLGACMLALENSSEDIKKNFLAGHSCGDELDLDENGRPQMALRISFGYHNSTKDVLKLVGFFEEFVKRSNLQENQDVEWLNQSDVSDSEPVRLQSLYVFPLKSAGALSRDKMRFHENGTPLLDRIYCVASGTSRQVVQGKHLPKLAKIKPRVDSTKPGKIRLHYTGAEDLVVEEDEKEIDENGNKEGISVCETRVCLRKIPMMDCGEKASLWLSKILGRELRLLKISSSIDGLNLQMKSPLLLVTTASLEWLRQKLINNGVKMSVSDLVQRFRPNLLLETNESFVEESWSSLKIGCEELKVQGNCTRCGAVCTNPTKGVREAEPLATLTQNREKTQFGIYVEISNPAMVLKRGDIIQPVFK